MLITYIGHSGFLAELKQSLLLFDYYEGPLPEAFPEKNLFVFASHRHPDHFNPEIFRLAEGRETPTFFILSDDIWERRVPKERLAKTLRLKPDADISFEGLEIRTLKSTDEGVAFLIRTEGKTIYHAGDLNDWRWPGEPESFNLKMQSDFQNCLEPLRGMEMDAAFIPLDPRQEAYYSLGFDYFLSLTAWEKGRTRIYPMHCWEDYSVIGRWLKQHPGHPARECLVSIGSRGETFQQ